MQIIILNTYWNLDFTSKISELGLINYALVDLKAKKIVLHKNLKKDLYLFYNTIIHELLHIYGYHFSLDKFYSSELDEKIVIDFSFKIVSFLLIFSHITEDVLYAFLFMLFRQANMKVSSNMIKKMAKDILILWNDWGNLYD